MTRCLCPWPMEGWEEKGRDSRIGNNPDLVRRRKRCLTSCAMFWTHERRDREREDLVMAFEKAHQGKDVAEWKVNRLERYVGEVAGYGVSR